MVKLSYILKNEQPLIQYTYFYIRNQHSRTYFKKNIFRWVYIQQEASETVFKALICHESNLGSIPAVAGLLFFLPIWCQDVVSWSMWRPNISHSNSRIHNGIAFNLQLSTLVQALLSPLRNNKPPSCPVASTFRDQG